MSYYAKIGINCNDYNKTIACTSNKKFFSFNSNIYLKPHTCTYMFQNGIDGVMKSFPQNKSDFIKTYYGKSMYNDDSTVEDTAKSLTKGLVRTANRVPGSLSGLKCKGC